VLISVIIPVRNAPPPYLSECLSSILAQADSPPFELILVDDASSAPLRKEYEQIIQDTPFSTNLRRVELIRSGEQIGIPAARNLGVANSAGEVLVFVDDDDFVEPEALRLVSDALDDGANFVYTDHVDCGERITQVLRERRKKTWHELYQLYMGSIWDPFLHATFLIHMHAVRRSVFENLGGWSTEIVYGDEPEFHTRFSQSCFARGLGHVPKVCYRHRSNPFGATTDPATLRRLLGNVEGILLARIRERGLISVAECHRLGRCSRTHTGVYAYRDVDGQTVSAPYLDPSVPSLRWVL